MSKRSTGLWLYALGEVQRPHPNPSTEAEEGRRGNLQVLSAGSVFEAEDDKQRDTLIRLNAAREATDDEITIEEDRREREGDEQGQEIVASMSMGDPGRTRAPRAEQATGFEAGSGSSTSGRGRGGKKGGASAPAGDEEVL